MERQEKGQKLSSDTDNNGLDDRRKILDELAYREDKKATQLKIRRILFIISIALIIVGIFFWMQTTFVSEFFIYGKFNPNDRDDLEIASNVKLFGSFFILFSIVIFSYLYMAGFDPRKRHRTSVEKTTETFESEENITIIALLKSIDKSIEKGKLESVLSDEERNAIIT